VPLLLKLETNGYPIRAIEGQVAVAQIALPGSHFPGPRCPFRYSSRCNFSAPDNKLFDRELSNFIQPPISHAIRFIGNALARIENKFGDDQIILSLQQSVLPTLFIFIQFILLSSYFIAVVYRVRNVIPMLARFNVRIGKNYKEGKLSE